MDTNNNKRLQRKKAKSKATLKKRISGKPSRIEENTLFSSFAFILRRTLLILLTIVLLFGFLLAGIGSGMLAGYISTAQAIDTSNLQNFDQTTVLLDMNGNQLTELKGYSGSRNEFVPYSVFSKTYIEEAFIAIEDERFLDHPGIDAKRIASSILSAIANGGTPTHGGSTITQQTVKMISGADDLSAQRKIQEWYSAIELEKTVSKEGILELYLNLVPMSNNITGIGAAARYYFNKDVSDLTLLESAFLAGIPNQPAIYNPMTEYGRRNSLRRMRTILAKMHDLKMITDEEYEQALAQELVFDFSYFEDISTDIYSWFEEYVIQKVISDLITRNGYSPELARLTVFNQGLTIETTVDPTLQNKLEQIYKDNTIRSKDPALTADSPEAPQSSITVLENNVNDPGRIRGMVGGFGEKKENFIFNRASDAKRQPASSIKPILVYGPAIDSGAISDATIFNDRPVQLDPYHPNDDYPLNSYRSYLGPINLEKALVNSTNTVAADVFMNVVTPEIALSYLRDLGIDRMSERFASTALGGFENGVSTLEMAGAYSALANQGIYVEPTCYTRVLRHDGTVLLDNRTPTQLPVFKPGTTSIITKNLEKVAANVNATPINMHAAGKTGTSEDMIDTWFCGYSPYYTAAIWYGFDNTNGRKIQVPEIDTFTSVGIWNLCMTAIHESLPDREFSVYDGITQATVCGDTGLLATAYCPNPFTAWLLDGSPANPVASCSYHLQPETEKTSEAESSEQSTPSSTPSNEEPDPNQPEPNHPEPTETTTTPTSAQETAPTAAPDEPTP